MFSHRQIYMSSCLGYQHQAQRLTIATLTSRRVADRDGGCVPDPSSRLLVLRVPSSHFEPLSFLDLFASPASTAPYLSFGFV